MFEKSKKQNRKFYYNKSIIFSFHKPLSFIIEQRHRFAADAADVTHPHASGFQRSSPAHVKHPVNGEYAPVFPDNRGGANIAVQIKFCVYFQIYFHFDYLK